MESTHAWDTRAREVAGDDARDGAYRLGCGEEVLLEVDEPGHDAADDYIDASEYFGQLLDAVGDIADPYLDALGH